LIELQAERQKAERRIVLEECLGARTISCVSPTALAAIARSARARLRPRKQYREFTETKRDLDARINQLMKRSRARPSFVSPHRSIEFRVFQLTS